MFNAELQKGMNQFPDGLGVRIPDSHSGGPGSIPGQGELFVTDYVRPIRMSNFYDSS